MSTYTLSGRPGWLPITTVVHVSCELITGSVVRRIVSVPSNFHSAVDLLVSRRLVVAHAPAVSDPTGWKGLALRPAYTVEAVAAAIEYGVFPGSRWADKASYFNPGHSYVPAGRRTNQLWEEYCLGTWNAAVIMSDSSAGDLYEQARYTSRNVEPRGRFGRELTRSAIDAAMAAPQEKWLPMVNTLGFDYRLGASELTWVWGRDVLLSELVSKALRPSSR